MSGLYGASSSSVSLSAATVKTVINLTGISTSRAKIVAWGISFNGTTTSAVPVTVDFLRQVSAGTGTAINEPPFDTVYPTAGVAARANFSAEPSAGDILESYFIHPQGGILIKEYPPGREVILDDATVYIGIRVNAPAAVSCIAWIQWEE